MGFNLSKKPETISITIDSLTQRMIGDLIIFYSKDIESIDVQMDNGIFERTGIIIDYPRISKETVNAFYMQMDALLICIIDVIVQEFHILYERDSQTNELVISYGDVPEDIITETETWVRGPKPLTITEVKQWTEYVIRRDYFEVGTWMFDFTEGQFDYLIPFIEGSIDQIYFESSKEIEAETPEEKETLFLSLVIENKNNGNYNELYQKVYGSV
jgi:hypothetical protein